MLPEFDRAMLPSALPARHPQKLGVLAHANRVHLSRPWGQSIGRRSGRHGYSRHTEASGDWL